MAGATTLQTTEPARQHWSSSSRSLTSIRLAGLVLGLGLIFVVALLSLRFGSLDLRTQDAWNAIFHYDATNYEQTIVRQLRLPRTIIALVVGGSLAVAGAIMQGVTRNPLAGPSILGVSSGASFGVTIAIFVFGISTTSGYVWFAFAGAMAASALVFLIGTVGSGGATPVKLALAGVVISALLGAWTSAVLLLSEETMDSMRFWVVGSVAGRQLSTLWGVLPFIVPGLLAGMLMGHQLNVLSMGEDNARALGMNTQRVRIGSSLLVVLLTGAAVSVAGPIGFVGLATPHIARAVVGSDYRWILPYSLIIGALLLTVADIVGRLITRPGELQVGIVMALVGAPFLIILARRRTVAG